jgi:hypothetical protein
MSETFICKHCGNCCLTYPCKFAQIRYGATPKTGCPDLVQENGKYRCLLIEKDVEVRKEMVTGKCDALSEYFQYYRSTKIDFSGLRDELIKRGYYG